MEADLANLEDRINTLAMLCQQLRQDNQSLRQQLTSAQEDNKRLSDKIGTAGKRLEQLIARLPSEAETPLE